MTVSSPPAGEQPTRAKVATTAAAAKARIRVFMRSVWRMRTFARSRVAIRRGGRWDTERDTVEG
jgi:hypothetical protein